MHLEYVTGEIHSDYTDEANKSSSHGSSSILTSTTVTYDNHGLSSTKSSLELSLSSNLLLKYSSTPVKPEVDI